MSVVRIGLVGCGRLAEVGYLPALALVAGAEVVAVADPDPVRRNALAARAGVDGFADLDALLGACRPDAVVLASPVATHVSDAGRAVASGAAVLVEKPPAPDAMGAAELAALGTLVRVGFNRRYDAGVRGIRDRVPLAGSLDIELQMRYRRASWGAYTVHDDILADLGPHLVDVIRWAGRREVTAVTTLHLSDDRAELEAQLDRGRARVIAAAGRYHGEQVTVRDNSGRLVARHRTGGAFDAAAGQTRAVMARARRRAVPHPLVRSVAAQLRDLCRVVSGDEPVTALATGADALAVMAVLDTARTSAARGGQPTPVTETLEGVPC